MAASTLEELGDDLDAGIAWRRAELQALRTQTKGLRVRDQRTPANRAALRASVVLLYAHWEGFVKQACQGYLDFIATRRLRFDQLSPALVQTAIRPVAGRAASDEEAVNQLAEWVAGNGTARARIPRRGVVETRSNLRHDVLLVILQSLGLPDDQFSTAAQLIDRELCDSRNAIAHGMDSFPDSESVEHLFERVLHLMETIRELILSNAGTQAYRSD